VAIGFPKRVEQKWQFSDFHWPLLVDTAKPASEITFVREETTLVAEFADSSSALPASAQEFVAAEVPGLKSTPMASAVNNATHRFSLPDPALAVRNLVRPSSNTGRLTGRPRADARLYKIPFKYVTIGLIMMARLGYSSTK
jgi:hypothetical protein